MSNILLGVTGSVATVLLPKLKIQLSDIGTVKTIATVNALHFSSIDNFDYTDKEEWTWKGNDIWQKNDPILHIELREWADIFVIAPLTANTLAKMAVGICDNLLTTVFLAWDTKKPIILAPAMNTKMLNSPQVFSNLDFLERHVRYDITIVNPVIKQLACNEEGEGAMAQIENICDEVKFHLTKGQK